MKYLLAVAAGMGLSVAGLSIVPYVNVLGVMPNLLLIFAACWAVIRGHDEALIVVAMTGFVHDLTSTDPVGMAVLAMLPVVPLAAAVRLRAMDSDFVPAVVVVAAASLSYGVIATAVLTVTGQDTAIPASLTRIVIPSMLVNALFTPIIYLPLRWLGTPPIARVLGPGRIRAQA
ncbi:MAG: rod shape-determining protein MreD [Gammaproteobacteria bacterium]